MGTFLNALSALAPIAPALSDARDLRLARQQQQQDFTSDQALKQAQLTTAQLAAEGEKQRQRQADQIRFIGEPQWNPLTHTYQATALDPNTGSLALKDVPGVDPSEAAEARYQAARANYKSITKKDLTPEEDEDLFFQSYGYKPPPIKLTPLTGAAGQPQEYPKGSGNYVTFGRDATGAIVAQPMPAGYTPPPPKPATSPGGIFANLLTKQILASKKQGPPLTNEEAAQLTATRASMDEAGVARSYAMAQANAANHLYLVTDPNSGMEIPVPVSAGIAAYNQGTPFLAGAISSPTATDKKNSMLAQSALQQVNRMESILNRDPNLTGPGAGQLTALQTWLGTQDPDAQAFLMSSLLGSEHGVAVFGGRNVHTIQDLQNTLGAWKTNPNALRSALQVIRETMAPWATAGGRLPAPRTSGSSGGSGSTPKFKTGDLFMQNGHKFKATAVDSSGKVTAADPIQ